jgi:hypothetical protein
MIIHNFNVVRVFAVPAEANAPLVVDAYAVLSGAIAFQGFQAVAGWQGLVAQFARAIKLRELSQGHALNLRRQTVVSPPLPQPLCFPASELGNHRINLSSHDNMSRGGACVSNMVEAAGVESGCKFRPHSHHRINIG